MWIKQRSQCKTNIKVDLDDKIVGNANEHTYPPSALKVEVTKVNCLYLLSYIAFGITALVVKNNYFLFNFSSKISY